jgi:hypothetical protein
MTAAAASPTAIDDPALDQRSSGEVLEFMAVVSRAVAPGGASASRPAAISIEEKIPLQP